MRHPVLSVALTVLLAASAAAHASGVPAAAPRFMDGVIIVKLDEHIDVSSGALTTGVASIDQKISEAQVHAIEQIFPYLEHSALVGASRLTRFYYFRYAGSANALQVAEVFSADPNIEHAEPKFLAYPSDTPNDEYYPTMTQFPHVGAPAAWDSIKGEAGDVIIAIVDTGTDWRHVDLIANVWTNPGEIPDNGVDDDANGFVDDVHGWNFPYDNGDPSPHPSGAGPNFDHGTHTAGTAAGVTNNNLGVASMSWNCTFMPINANAFDGALAIEFGYEAIVYAAANGADIISNSWLTYDYSVFGQEVVNFAHANGSLLVAAAGNDSYDFDLSPAYPAGYRHVLSVGATQQNNDVKPGFSNYGVTVDVFAPGVNILSTVPGDGYESGYGTSMATPMVSGLAGLVKTLHPSWTNDQIGEQVRVTCDSIDGANPSYAGRLGKGRINAYRAVNEEGNPSIRIAGYSYTESDGDGIISPGDTVDVTVSFINYLAGTSNIDVQLTVDDTLIILLNGSAVIPSLGTDEVDSVAFQFAVDPTAPDGHTLVLATDITANGYADRDLFCLTVNPLNVVTHTTTHIQTSVTVEGNIGWTDFAGSDGVGFLYDGEQWLHEGGVLIATSATQVSDCIRGANVNLQDDDFRSISDLSFVSPARWFNEISAVDVDDSLSPNPIGVLVHQWAVAGVIGVPQTQGLIAIIYEIGNVAQPPVSGLHVGFFMDWNINAGGNDYARLDPTRKLGYVQNAPLSPTKLAGVKLLVREVDWSYRSIDNPNELDDGFTEAEKWSFMSGGIQTVSLNNTDVSTLIAAGPVAVDPLSRAFIGFCAIGATSLAELQARADAAQAVWDQFFGVNPGEILSGELVGGELVLSWWPWEGSSAYWVYGASNNAWFEPGFAPGFEYRLAVLPPATMTWSSSAGVGDSSNNWTYLVVAVDDVGQELQRTNRIGEHDFGANTQ
jgi:serine protease